MASLSDWSLPAVLNPPLSGRDAVIDAVQRALIGLDTNDVELFKSALTKDSSFTINGNTTSGTDTIVSGLFVKICSLDTTHFLCNVRVNIDGAKAVLSATALAQHYRGGTGSDPKAERFLAGAFYLVDLEREDDGGAELWKIADWKMQLSWGEGDRSIVM